MKDLFALVFKDTMITYLDDNWVTQVGYYTRRLSNQPGIKKIRNLLVG